MTPVNIFRRSICLLIAFSALAAAGCSGSQTSDRDLVLVDTDAAPALVAGKGSLLGMGGREGAWVDPRSDADYSKGHIPGAVHMPFTRVSEQHEILRKYKVLIVYGDGYRDIKAEGMAKRLLEFGHKDVRVLRGGLQAWTAAGNALETGKPKS